MLWTTKLKEEINTCIQGRLTLRLYGIMYAYGILGIFGFLFKQIWEVPLLFKLILRGLEMRKIGN
jgi:hypothetical protein